MANLSHKNKTEARLFFKKQLDSLSPARRKNAAEQLFSSLASLLTSYPHVLSFMPTDLEINTIPFNRLLAGEGRLLLPKVSGDDLHIYKVNNIDHDLTPSPFGIQEPLASNPTFPTDKISLVLVPALAFDVQKNRLGTGHGYYDRFLHTLPSIPLYGVGFTEQLVQQLPTEPHDLPVTELFLF